MYLQLPIATIQSGPVNSLRGAAALTGLSDAILLDIGKPTRLLPPKASALPLLHSILGPCLVGRARLLPCY